MDKPRYRAHYGGPQPVSDRTAVEVLFLDGGKSVWLSAGGFGDSSEWWEWKGPDYLKIVAYRVLGKR